MNEKRQEKYEKAVVLKSRMAAFSEYLSKGIDFVKKSFPSDVDFVLANKDKSFEDVSAEIDKGFIELTKQLSKAEDTKQKKK